MKSVVSVQARMSSQRLPGKVLLPLGERRLLGWVLARCEDSGPTEGTVVAIGDEPPNDVIVDWCERQGHEYVVGPEDDLVERHLSVVRATGADVLVRITGDSPLLPPEEIDRLLAEHADHAAAYTTNFTDETPRGMVVDVFDTDLLHEVGGEGHAHPATELRSNANDQRVKVSSNPLLEDVASVDVEVDTPADYWRISDALEAEGPDPLAVTRWLRDAQ